MEMHGKSIRMYESQVRKTCGLGVWFTATRFQGRRGEAGAPGHYRRRRGDTRQSESAIRPIRIRRHYTLVAAPGITRILYVPPPAASRTYREKEYPSWVYAL